MTSHLCYEGTFQQCIIDISPEVARRPWLTIENRVLVAIRLHMEPCPVPRQCQPDRWGDLAPSWSPGGGNYLVDKTSSELRPGRPQTVRPVITEEHSSPSVHVFPVQLLFKNNFHQIKKIFDSDEPEPTSCQCSENPSFSKSLKTLPGKIFKL